MSTYRMTVLMRDPNGSVEYVWGLTTLAAVARHIRLARVLFPRATFTIIRRSA